MVENNSSNQDECLKNDILVVQDKSLYSDVSLVRLSCLLTAGILSSFVMSGFVVLYLVPQQISFWIIHSLLSFWLLPWAYCFQRKFDSLNGLTWLHSLWWCFEELLYMLMLGSTFAPRLCLLTFGDD